MADHHVVGLDVDVDRVCRVARGELPFFEAGLQDALLKALSTGRFTATSDRRRAVAGADIIFLCVGTPSSPDGSMDDTFLKGAAKGISKALPDDGRPIGVVKSTVVPGTTENVVRPILEASNKRFGLGVNPEFLREGHALKDTLHPDRIVLGVDGPETAQHLRALYANVTCPVVETDLTTAEAIKYATHAL